MTVAERFIPALLAVGVLALSVHLGPDASWDLRNYHIYNPFALLRKPAGVDLIPAQMQSFLPPGPDLAPFWLRQRLNAHPDLLDAILALPSAVGAVLAFRIGLLLLPRPGLAALAVAFGVTGAAGLPTIGTSASEMPGGCFVLGGLLVLLRTLGKPRPGAWDAALAGALLGVALAIKLTMAPYVAGAVMAFLVCAPGRAGQAVRLGAGVLAGALAVGGPWWLHLYRLTGDPIFPYYNNIFHSAWNAPIAMEDNRFLPRGPGQVLAYPFYWGFQKTRIVTEVVMRDPRLAFAYLAVAASLATGLVRRIGRAPLCFLLFMAIGFALWQFEFSIFRYIAPLELLSGLPVLLALRPLLRTRPHWATACAVTGVFLLLFTRYPNWGRAWPRDHAVAVTVPALPPGSMVVILTNEPVGYVAAFADPAVRFIGADNNLVHPGDTTGLARQVEAAIHDHGGPLWGLELPGSPATQKTLDHYGLHGDGDCLPIISNLDGSAFRLCPLTR